MPRNHTLARLAAAALCAAPLASMSQTDTSGGDFWRLVASPYTVHFHSPNEDEHEPIYMIGLERQRNDGWVWGGIYFSNSFGQPSAYLYLGERFHGFSPWPQLFAQWTAGLLYGYKYPYDDKVPLNVNGFSPGATLSLGWQFTRQFSAQANLLGGAGMMFQVSIDFR
jgi:hypothetical protein